MQRGREIEVKGRVVKINCQRENWIAFSLKLDETFEIDEDEVKLLTEAQKEWPNYMPKVKENYLEKINANGSFGLLPEGAAGVFKGYFYIDKTKGVRFDVTNYEIEKDENWVISLLTTANGIGYKTAVDIVQHFGKDTVDILKHHPKRLKEIKGIGDVLTKKITEQAPALIDAAAVFEVTGGKISQRQYRKLVDKYGSAEKVKDVLLKDPYILIKDISGFGFKTVDAIAQGMGISEDSIFRVEAGLIYALESSTDDGHCFLTAKELETKAMNALLPLELPSEVKDTKLPKAFLAIFRNWRKNREDFLRAWEQYITGDIITYLDSYVEKYKKFIQLLADGVFSQLMTDENPDGQIIIEGCCIYRSKYFFMEEEVASTLVRCAQEKAFCKKTPYDVRAFISEKEKTMSYTLENEQIDAVVKALTNRVTCIVGGPGRGKTTIIKMILNTWSGNNVLLCAPTGQAAKRMREATGRESCTVQRIIARGERIERGTLVIVDEFSMSDIVMTHKLLTCTRECQLVFVGDINQLPSIGPGKVLRDIVESNVIPVSKLLKGHRNKGSIAENADLINEGKFMKEFKMDEHFVFHQTEKEDIPEKILKLKKSLMKRYREEDIKVLSPVRVKTGSGTDNLNKRLKEQCLGNLKRIDIPKTELSVKDRVLNIENDTVMDVVNGDTGFIESFDEEDGSFVVRMDDSTSVKYEKSDACMLTLGYATTIHKSQGSEYPVVIIVCSTEHYVMLKRNLLYTGVTRARAEVHVVGSEKAVNLAIMNIDDKQRNTKLKERLQKHSNIS